MKEEAEAEVHLQEEEGHPEVVLEVIQEQDVEEDNSKLILYLIYLF